MFQETMCAGGWTLKVQTQFRTKEGSGMYVYLSTWRKNSSATSLSSVMMLSVWALSTSEVHISILQFA